MAKPISCVRTNVQPGFRRFPDPHFQPLIKSWRCELTALSHAYNLYFVACNETIYIYRPSFPCQYLVNDNSFFLNPPQSSPNLPYGIDEEDPHSITRLHVDYLGMEEVLIVTCDDGDVIVYRVPEIFRVVENRSSLLPFETDGDLGDEVRVFRHLNVGESAWGIAVHRQARLMAISANTQKITVFAYALSDPCEDSNVSEGSESDPLSSEEASQGFLHNRKTDRTIVLKGNTNIPAVSFENTDDAGRWLVSSSIDGKTHIWDLHHPQQPARIISLGCCVSAYEITMEPQLCQCLNRTSVPHAAWAAMFIDPQACYRASTLQEACGSISGETGPYNTGPRFWDITETEHRFTSTRVAPLLPPSDNFYADSEDFDEIPLSDTVELDDEEEGENEHASQEGNESQGSDEMSIDNTHEPQPQTSHDTDDTIVQQPQSEPQSPDDDDTSDFNFEASLVFPSNNSDFSDSDAELDSLIMIHDAAGQAALHIFYPPAPDPDNPRELPRQPYCQITSSSCFLNSPPCFPLDHAGHGPSGGPLIIVTKEEIYLFQRPLHRAGDHYGPILYMRHPLFPMTSPSSSSASSRGPIPYNHRHCYATQIPELGIFIVATPAGRVGIFSLTRFKMPDGFLLFGFRLDAILPCKDDDEKGRNVIADVWGKRLIGIAVGPVQGMLDGEGGVGGGAEFKDEDNDDGDEDDHSAGSGSGSGSGRRSAEFGGPRRWRLMIHFHDHTVYSYELGKQSGTGVAALGELMV